LNSPSILGGAAPESTPAAPGFNGEIDEMQISKVARPSGFIKVSALNQGGDGAPKLLVLGEDEQSELCQRIFCDHSQIGNAGRLGCDCCSDGHGGCQLDHNGEPGVLLEPRQQKQCSVP